MISDLKEDTKTEEKRKEVSHRPGGEGRPATPEKVKRRRSPYGHLKRQDGPGQRKITIFFAVKSKTTWGKWPPTLKIQQTYNQLHSTQGTKEFQIWKETREPTPFTAIQYSTLILAGAVGAEKKIREAPVGKGGPDCPLLKRPSRLTGKPQSS